MICGDPCRTTQTPKIFAIAAVLMVLAAIGCGKGFDGTGDSRASAQAAADGVNGCLTLASMIKTVTNPGSVAVTPSRKYAYAIHMNGSVIAQYIIGEDGVLLPMNKATVDAGTDPVAIVVDPSGRYVYVANHGGNSISQYTIGTDGSLSCINTATVSTGTEPRSIAADPSGRYVYVANYGNDTLSQYTIGADGSLSLASTLTVPEGMKPFLIVADPSGRYVYVASDGCDTVSQYAIDTDGSLLPVTAVQIAAAEQPHAAGAGTANVNNGNITPVPAASPAGIPPAAALPAVTESVHPGSAESLP